MPNGEGTVNTSAYDVYEERDANKRAAACGGTTMTDEAGNTTKTYIDKNNIKEHIHKRLIYRYNGKTYK